jgi:hypothetical protein
LYAHILKCYISRGQKMAYIQINDNTLQELRELMQLKYPHINIKDKDDAWVVSYVMDRSIKALKNVADPVDSTRFNFIERAMGNAETTNLWKNIHKDF